MDTKQMNERAPGSLAGYVMHVALGAVIGAGFAALGGRWSRGHGYLFRSHDDFPSLTWLLWIGGCAAAAGAWAGYHGDRFWLGDSLSEPRGASAPVPWAKSVAYIASAICITTGYIWLLHGATGVSFEGARSWLNSVAMLGAAAAVLACLVQAWRSGG